MAHGTRGAYVCSRRPAFFAPAAPSCKLPWGRLRGSLLSTPAMWWCMQQQSIKRGSKQKDASISNRLDMSNHNHRARWVLACMYNAIHLVHECIILAPRQWRIPYDHVVAHLLIALFALNKPVKTQEIDKEAQALGLRGLRASVNPAVLPSRTWQRPAAAQ